MSTKKPHPLISDKIIRFIFGILVFSALISGGTYYLQSSLVLLKAFGLFAHWAAILILLPVLSGLVQHLIAPPARLLVPILGALASTIILYPLYAEHFWAIPPSITDTIVFTLAIAGIGFTASINPHDRHVKQRRAIKNSKKSSNKKEVHEDGLTERLLNSSMIRSVELALTIFSIIAGIWGTLSLGLSAL
ncbi:hypothetical protein OAK48_01740 [Deltaproteobacteria bacterium]|nr:hypothetical protein [Deltaproteobacteria bacterium]